MSELDVLIWIHDNMSNWVLDGLCEAANLLDSSYVIILSGLILTAIPQTRKIGILMVIAQIFSSLSIDLLKSLVDRTRPFDMYDIELLIGAPGNASFPSAHAGNAFTMAAAVYLYRHREGIILGIWAAFVCFSRLYLFVHFPTDVIAGAFVAVVATLAAYVVLDAIARKVGLEDTSHGQVDKQRRRFHPPVS